MAVGNAREINSLPSVRRLVSPILSIPCCLSRSPKTPHVEPLILD